MRGHLGYGAIQGAEGIRGRECTRTSGGDMMVAHSGRSPDQDEKPNPTVERSKFGVSKKPKNPEAEEFRAPIPVLN